MKQEFKLIQTKTGPLLFLWLFGFVAVVAVALKGADLVPMPNETLQKGWFIAFVGGGGYLLFRLGKKVAAKPISVTIAPDSLTSFNCQSGTEIRYYYNSIASYRAQCFNGAEELRLTLHNGQKKLLRVNTNLFGEQNFQGMVQAFEAAISAAQPVDGTAKLVRREPSFFEKPISTVVLVAFTMIFAWFVWFVTTNDKPISGGIFSIAGTYLIFVASWFAARERRNRSSV